MSKTINSGIVIYKIKNKLIGGIKMKKIIIYSTATWPWCTKVKDYLDEKNISYEDYDVAGDREKAIEMVNKSNQQGVPVIDIDGQIIVGFDQKRIDRALDL